MYRHIMVFGMKKNKKLLVFTIFSFFSTKSFANEIETEKKVEIKEDEYIDNIQSELEEIEKQWAPDYTSGIFLSLPANIGFNVLCGDNTNAKNVKFGIFGSQNIDLSCFVNFPINTPHIYIAAGVEVGKNSLFWDGKKTFSKIKLFSQENNNDIYNTIFNEEAIESTRVSCWETGICGKLTFYFDKFDPRDGFNVALRIGAGLQFCGSLETTRKQKFNGVELNFSGNDDLIGINRFYAFGGLDLGYQRMAIFLKYYFTPFFDSDKISEDEVSGKNFCFGFSFDLL